MQFRLAFAVCLAFQAVSTLATCDQNSTDDNSTDGNSTSDCEVMVSSTTSTSPSTTTTQEMAGPSVTLTVSLQFDGDEIAADLSGDANFVAAMENVFCFMYGFTDCASVPVEVTITDLVQVPSQNLRRLAAAGVNVAFSAVVAESDAIALVPNTDIAAIAAKISAEVAAAAEASDVTYSLVVTDASLTGAASQVLASIPTTTAEATATTTTTPTTTTVAADDNTNTSANTTVAPEDDDKLSGACRMQQGFVALVASVVVALAAA